VSARELRWGLAGCGWIARDHVAPAMGRVQAVLDPDPARRAAIPGRPAVSTDDLDAFLAAGLDAVYVATPNDQHRPLVEACAAAGLPVLCEKPMATSLADAEAMVAACREHGVLYATAHNQRFHPAHEALAALVARGELGTVSQARIHYACTAPAWWDAADWHWDPARAGGGAVFDLAPHGLDLIGVLLGADLVETTSLLQRADPVEEGGVVVGRWTGDVLGIVQVSYACPETLPRRTLELVGTAGMARALDTMGQDPGGTLEVVDAADGRARSVPFDAAGDPFARELAAFERAVRGEEPWPWPVERDLAVMAALEDAVRPRGVPA
jgi:predicted dehydrogenase